MTRIMSFLTLKYLQRHLWNIIKKKIVQKMNYHYYLISGYHWLTIVICIDKRKILFETAFWDGKSLADIMIIDGDEKGKKQLNFLCPVHNRSELVPDGTGQVQTIMDASGPIHNLSIHRLDIDCILHRILSNT